MTRQVWTTAQCRFMSSDQDPRGLSRPSSCRKQPKLLGKIFRLCKHALVTSEARYASMGMISGEVIESANDQGRLASWPFILAPDWVTTVYPHRSFLPTCREREFERCTRFIELAGGLITSHAAIHVVVKSGEACERCRKR